jgi:predicted NBD/HSP70 family sugar kinase/DNA-binding MarR family transcriptional regulator
VDRNIIIVQATPKAKMNRRTVRRTTRHKPQIVANLEAEILLRVRARQDLSRVELASQLKLAPSTVGTYVDRLIAEGFLVEWQKPERDYGRPPTLLALNPGGGFFVGVDFDARKLLGTIVDFSDRPIRQLEKQILPTDSAEQVIGKIEQTIEELAAGQMKDVLGIGIGVPGSIDPQQQIALGYAHIRGWENIPLGKLLADHFKVNVFLENNIRSMALAELWFGQGRGLDNFVCLGIRTGIAAGIIAHSELLHGEKNLAGEIRGWLCPVGPVRRQTGSGGRVGAWDCAGLQALEQIASVPAILKAVNAGIAQGKETILKPISDPVAFEDVVYAAAKGDPFVNSVLADVAQTLGWVCCQLNALFNPPKIILAGPLVNLGAAFLNPLQNAVNEFCAETSQPAPVIVYSELGSFNGALGAAALALHKWKPTRHA